MGKDKKIKREEKDSLKLNELKNQLARALADYDNLRKRVEKEKEDLGKIIAINIVLKVLPIFDMLEDAQRHLKDSGVAMILSEFAKILKGEGIEKIKVERGMKFDENLHEAVEMVKGGRKGEIAEEVLPGWQFTGGGVIREAKVKVYGEEVKKKDLERKMAEEYA
ncbi:nucleotide exchange factor GrpE [Candidatus Woesebacteria bacterium RIFCSPHIGHO2_01_FULL_38_10]|uniref:Protein GrpE n=1 Tax=Candidatus Woesebacteria bacterium RIFCSPLOWO2_01_FULL_39_10b TaxID=1802517 RepID=A0A1F8BAA4_9BACT|nr:MAG: nucleotide exchange factor GrpE [Candidatus Woesebacteria bacterium RIFCSPHIGHO2_01_FULL_38_10]OGM60870.1 MAG: nucleotide exchange factor GrpE [Candidatus Woesebacteria bacterium RIFCSPLOWO2_01_FULL_39_10b]